MTGIRWLSIIVLSATLAVDVSAQVIVLPQPVVPVLVPNGIDFSYNSKRLAVSGFFATGGYSPAFAGINPVTGIPRVIAPGYYPYYGYGYPVYGPSYPSVILGSVDTRYSLQIINPPGLVQTRPASRSIAYDTAGIDLDVESAAKIWGNKPAVQVAGAKEKEDPAKKAPPVKVAKLDDVKLPEPAPLIPKKPGLEDAQRQLDTGVTAFRNGDYGIAILRFRQVAESDIPSPRAPFLQGQTYIAVGKYREAVQVIQQGLKQEPNWPGSGFRPKTELYGKDEESWKQHLQRLEQAQREQPKNADYLFLLGYVAWFDGRKNAAVDYLRQSRALADDPRWADLFLKAAK